MDLADIRKKARTQGLISSDSVATGELLPTIETTDELLAVEPVGGMQFWDEIGTVKFTTEEEYTQGLSAAGTDAQEFQQQWLGFFLGTEEYALDLEVISELIKPRMMTQLPHVPDYVCGIISLRGEVIPVLDLKSRLGLELSECADSDLQRIVVCEGTSQRIGLLVDRISQVLRLQADEIEVPQLVGDDPAAAFIQAVGRKQGRMLIQLRPEKALEIDGGPRL